jgi:cysteine desulfurase
MIYLDNQTATRPFKEAIDKMAHCLQNHWGSLSSSHSFGQKMRLSVAEAYSALYDLFDADEEDNLIITSSGAEAINHVIWSVYFNISRKTGKNHFVTTAIEEAPIILSFERLQEFGCAFFQAKVSQGELQMKSLIESLTPRTALVSLSWANGLTGVIQPIQEISKICKERGILLHVDASHVLGKGAFSFKESGADFLTFNGELIHGPKGVGGLLIRQNRELHPFIVGGNDQCGLRGGGFNTAACIALGYAASQLKKQNDYCCIEIARLRHFFEEKLLRTLPEISICFQEKERVPHITAIDFKGVYGEALAFLLNRKGLCANFGGGNYQQLHYLLKSSGMDTHSALSFGLSLETTEKEIQESISLIADAVIHLRKNSEHLFP